MVHDKLLTLPLQNNLARPRLVPVVLCRSGCLEGSGGLGSCTGRPGSACAVTCTLLRSSLGCGACCSTARWCLSYPFRQATSRSRAQTCTDSAPGLHASSSLAFPERMLVAALAHKAARRACASLMMARSGAGSLVWCCSAESLLLTEELLDMSTAWQAPKG